MDFAARFFAELSKYLPSKLKNNIIAPTDAKLYTDG